MENSISALKHKPNRRKKGKQKIKFKHAQNKAKDYFKEFLNDLTWVFGL